MAEVDETVVDEVDPNLTPEALAKWAMQQSMGGAVNPEEDEPGDDEDVDPEGDETPANAKTGTQAADPAIEGKPVLMAKDGKHTLPYSRLEESNAARDAAKAEAEAAKKQAEETAQQLAEARAQLEALQNQEKAGTATPAAVSQSADELEASIAAIEQSANDLEEESPYLAEQQRNSAKVMRGILAANRALEQRLAQEKQDVEAKTQAEVNALQETERAKARAALDADPNLSFWEKNKPAFFSEAADIDKTLREQGAWAAKPYAERFKEVTRQMVARYGEVILPPGSKGSPKPKPKLPDGSDLSDVHTLTDFSGGTPTSQNPLESVETASVADLARAMEKMSPEEILRTVTRG